MGITDEERNDYEKLAEKYNDYGVNKIEVVSNDTVFRDSAGNIIEGAQAGYDKNTGVIYITEDTAGKPLGEFNRIVGEEIGELYAHKNGLATETGGAEQIGQIFGKEMSKGKDSASEYTGTIVVNDTIKDIKVDGTDKYAAGLTAVFRAKLSEKEIQYIEKKLNLLEVNSIKNAQEDAVKMTANIFYEIKDNFYQDEADAFRHAYWNALMAQNLGYKGLNFAYAHEGLEPGEPADRIYNGSKLIDVQMDVRNNRVGYEIGRANPKLSKEKLAVLVLQKLKSGDLKVINSKTYQVEKIDGKIKELSGGK